LSELVIVNLSSPKKFVVDTAVLKRVYLFFLRHCVAEFSKQIVLERNPVKREEH
jgi:hypothetical protein